MHSEIVINGRFLTRKSSGVDRFAMELLRAWLPGQQRTIRAVMPDRERAVDQTAFELPVETIGALDGHAWNSSICPGTAVAS